MPRSAAASSAALLALLLGAVDVLGAQVVRGRVVDAETGGPARGAIVSLVGADGLRLAPALSREDGGYVVQAPAPGTYRVRVDLIGYEAWTSDTLVLAAADTASLDVRLPLRRVQLATVTVEGTSRCEPRPDQAERTVALWEEIRRALTISAISERRGLVPLDLTVTEERRTRTAVGAAPVRRGAFGRDTYRTRAPATALTRERVLSREQQRTRGAGARPWATRPPDELAARGFVQEVAGAHEYVGPDVPILLSNAFLETHCFRPVRRDRLFGDDAIGLAFEPTPGRTVPDVAGAIWLDARTSELQRVEFDFVNLPDSLRALGDAGGYLEFARQPTGAWYVRRWAIERGGLTDARGGTFVHRTTGEAVPVGNAPTTHAPAVLAGIVVDSTVGEGMPDATVRVPGVEPVLTDSLGRFAVTVPALPADSLDFVVAVEHPRFAVLGLASAEHTVRLRAGTTSTLVVATPSLPTLLGALCPMEGAAPLDERGLPRLGMLVGRATDAAGAPLTDGARVVAEWSSDEGLGVGTAARIQQRAVAPAADGRFRLCPLPVGRTLQLHVEVNGVAGPTTDIVVPAFGIAQMDLTGGQ